MKILCFGFLLCFVSGIETIIQTTTTINRNKVVGFFSLCQNSSESNILTQSSLQLKANASYTVANLIFKESNNKRMFGLYRFTYFDVCYSSDAVNRAIIDLLLGSKKDEILLVLAHIPSNLLYQIYSILKLTTVWIIDLNLETRYDYNNILSDPLFFHVATDSVNKRPWLDAKMILSHRWYSIAILCIKHEFYRYEFYYRKLTDTIESWGSSQYCYAVKFIDVNSPVEGFVPFLNNSKAIVLYGSPESQLKVLKKLQNYSQLLVNDKFWLTHDLRRKTIGYDIYIPSRVWHIESSLTFSSQLYTNYTIPIMKILTNIDYFRMGSFLNWMYYNDLHHSKYLKFITATKRYINYYEEVFSPRIPKQKTLCKHIVCPAGEEITFGKFSIKDELFFGERCIPCKANFWRKVQPLQSYKDLFSMTKRCVKCPPFTISSADRNKCIDPYIPLFITADLTFSKIAITSTALALLCVFIIATTFIYFRATPIVRGADLKMTFLHVLSHTLLHILLLFSFLSKPSTIWCYMRPLAISFFHVINISITLAKSEKLLKAFHGTTRVSSNWARKFQTMQAFGIALFVLIGKLLLLISVISAPPKVTKKLSVFTERLSSDNEELTVKNQYHVKLMSCNTLQQVNILIIYITLLQLFCLVQAFRSRKLPSTYKSCMSVVYGNFINTILSLIYIGIFVFQKQDLEKHSLQWLFVSLNNLVALVFTYGHKIYVVLFLPQRNDQSFVREERLQKIKNNLGISPRSPINSYSTITS